MTNSIGNGPRNRNISSSQRSSGSNSNYRASRRNNGYIDYGDVSNLGTYSGLTNYAQQSRFAQGGTDASRFGGGMDSGRYGQGMGPGRGQGMGQGPGMGDGHFEQLDADMSGTLSESELEDMASRISSETGESISASDLFSMMDLDGDGAVSGEEMEASRPPPPPPGEQGYDNQGYGSGYGQSNRWGNSSDDSLSGMSDQIRNRMRYLSTRIG